MARLNGSRLGLIGAGRIGQAVAARAAAFGMHTFAYDPFLDSRAVDAPIELSSLHVVTTTSDFLSIHVPASPDTRHLISEPELRSMKANAILINTARGALIDQPALVRALQLGWIRGAALDVFESRAAGTEQSTPEHGQRHCDATQRRIFGRGRRHHSSARRSRGLGAGTR